MWSTIRRTYVLLAQDHALKYETLKLFERTEDGFLSSILSSKCRLEAVEISSEFSVRVESLLNRRKELCNVDHSFEGLIDLNLRDQVLSMCSKDLFLFLKNAILKTLMKCVH